MAADFDRAVRDRPDCGARCRRSLRRSRRVEIRVFDRNQKRLPEPGEDMVMLQCYAVRLVPRTLCTTYDFMGKKFSFFRHPDKSNHPEAETKFIEITTAYEVNHLYRHSCLVVKYCVCLFVC